MPLGFVLPYDLADNWQYQMENPAEVQNDLCLLLGTDDVLVPVETEVSGSGCTFTADMAGEYYVYIQNKKVKNVKASLPSGEKNFSNVDRGYLLEMGNLSEGSRITLTPGESGETLTAAVYRFSPRAMIQVYDRLSQSPLHLDSWRDTKLTGTVTAAESGTLFLSIPYDEGWTITIDGQPAEGEKILEAFLSVPVEAGTHEISLIYMPGGLIPGVVISGASAAVLVLLWIVKRRRPSQAGV